MLSGLLSFAVDQAVSFALGQGWLGALIGGAASLLSAAAGFFTKGWLRWLVLTIGVAAVCIFILSLQLGLARRDATIAELRAAAALLERDKTDALRANAAQTAQLRALTVARDAQASRARAAETARLAAETRLQRETLAIINEVNHAATPADDAPLPPGLRAALRGLRDRYGADDGH